MASIDPATGEHWELTSPAQGGFAITADGNPLAFITRAIYVGGSGDLTVTLMNGNIVTLYSVPGGSVLPIRAISVANSSTVSNLVGLY